MLLYLLLKGVDSEKVLTSAHELSTIALLWAASVSTSIFPLAFSARPLRMGELFSRVGDMVQLGVPVTLAGPAAHELRGLGGWER